MPDINEMTKEDFVTCDLLDANPESQVCLPNIEGKSFYSFGGKDKLINCVAVPCCKVNKAKRICGKIGV